MTPPVFLPPAVLLYRRQLYEQAEYTPEMREYVREHYIDPDVIAALAAKLGARS